MHIYTYHSPPHATRTPHTSQATTSELKNKPACGIWHNAKQKSTKAHDRRVYVYVYSHWRLIYLCVFCIIMHIFLIFALKQNAGLNNGALREFCSRVAGLVPLREQREGLHQACGCLLALVPFADEPITAWSGRAKLKSLLATRGRSGNRSRGTRSRAGTRCRSRTRWRCWCWRTRTSASALAQTRWAVWWVRKAILLAPCIRCWWVQ
jgi:hypothetical protein